MRRFSAALLVPLLGSGLLAACSSDGADAPDGAASAADALASALASDAVAENGDPLALADLPFLDADASDVADDYADVVAGMEATPVTVTASEVEGSGDTDGAERTVTLSWSWAVTDEESWVYTSEATLTRADGAWATTWDHALVQPDLRRRDTLAVSALTPERGEITGADDAVLVTERPVLRYGIDKTQLPLKRALVSARTLAGWVGIDPASYVKTVRNAGDKAFVEAITYRKGEVPARVRGKTSSDLPGLLVVSGSLALAPTKEFAAPILGRVGPVTAEMVADDPDTYASGDIAGISGLQNRYDEQLRGTPGRQVEILRHNGNRRTVFDIAAVDGEPLALTLDEDLQTTAEDLLDGLGENAPASALVAIRPSDGAILAAANGSGTDGQNYATYAQAAPGSTFKIVSSLALLRSGLTPSSKVTCPSQVSVDGKTFENYDDYPSSSLGTIPFTTAVAQSCNTAFIGQRDRIEDGDLAEAAGSLGLGIDHEVGFPAYFGQVPDPASETEGAADLIGQGKILASPMAMAAVIASVQSGQTVIPHLIQTGTPGDDADTDPTGEKLTTSEAKRLRTMLRATVTSGSGAGLADVPGKPVIAKTGTAEFDDDGTTALHAWMVAAQGDLAVAVYVERGTSGSQTAGPVLEAFLRAAG